jgi:hypothetical protein
MSEKKDSFWAVLGSDWPLKWVWKEIQRLSVELGFRKGKIPNGHEKKGGNPYAK